MFKHFKYKIKNHGVSHNSSDERTTWVFTDLDTLIFTSSGFASTHVVVSVRHPLTY